MSRAFPEKIRKKGGPAPPPPPPPPPASSNNTSNRNKGKGPAKLEDAFAQRNPLRKKIRRAKKPRCEAGFVGLENQGAVCAWRWSPECYSRRGGVCTGATCYMNSLLQTLYMTPEFKKSLYQWRYDESADGAPHTSIPYQVCFSRLLRTFAP